MAENGQKEKSPGRSRGLLPIPRGVRLSRPNASAVGVRPLVLVGVAAGADERRRRPGALVVGLVAPAVIPGIQLLVGHRFTRLVTDEMLLVLHRRPARDLAAAAARVRLDGVLDRVRAAVEVAVIGAVGKSRSAAGGRSLVRGIGGARDDDLVDRAVVEGMAR